jgi:hypothetical protein
MPLKTIASRFTPVELNARARRKILTTLKIIYEGGSRDGAIANFPSRDVCSVVAGIHCGHRHLFETYKRSISLNLPTGRTIFRCAGVAVKSNNTNCWKRLLAILRLRKKAIVI